MSGEQLRFEVDLFHQILDFGSDFTAYPFGICHVGPGIDTVELEVESERRTDVKGRCPLAAVS